MKSSRELKQLAKAQIRGHFLMLLVVTLVAILIVNAVASILSVIGVPIGAILGCIVIGLPLCPIVGYALSAVAAPFHVGLIRVYTNMVNNGAEPSFSVFFSPWKDKWFNMMLASFLVNLYTYLWGLLFIIPGIVKSYAYSQTFYILAENPNLSASEAISISKEMMDGYKTDLFWLDLTFIGWRLLEIITCGLVSIWVTPFYNTTRANFYNECKIANYTNQ